MAADVKAQASVLRKTSVILQASCIGCRHNSKCQNVGGNVETQVVM